MANPPKRIVLDVCISNAHMNSKRLRYAERLMRIAGRGVSGSDIAQNKDYQTNICSGRSSDQSRGLLYLSLNLDSDIVRDQVGIGALDEYWYVFSFIWPTPYIYYTRLEYS